MNSEKTNRQAGPGSSPTRRYFLRTVGQAFLPVAVAQAFLPVAQAPSRSWKLRGIVCTMNDRREVLPDGVVWMENGKIRAVAASPRDLPPEAQKLPVTETHGIIYPGLIDLHKHMTYDIRGPWFPSRRFRNRTEFFNDPEYKSTVENPCRLLVQYMDLLNDVCLYAEVKALAGGTTSLQGAAIYDPGYASELVRNVEFENFGQDRVHQTIWDVDAESAARLRRLMPRLDAWIYHLAEGVDDYARRRFEDLKNFGLLTNKLVAIHCLGLQEAQFQELARAGASMVWSPLGNLRLYGSTANVEAARKAGVNLCLGSEWAPSGSKNLLMDLKVADQWNRKKLGRLFSDRELVEMVTVNPARAVGWKDKAGRLAPGLYADLLVLEKNSQDPYRNLIEATEESVALVVIDGEPVYGDPDLMTRLKRGPMEMVRSRRGFLKTLDMGDGPGRFTSLTHRLSDALALEDSSLPRLLDRLKVRRALNPNPPPVQKEYPYFLDIGDEPLEGEEVRQFLKAVFPEGVAPFPLDPLFVSDDDAFPRVAHEPVLLENGVELMPYFRSLLVAPASLPAIRRAGRDAGATVP